MTAKRSRGKHAGHLAPARKPPKPLTSQHTTAKKARKSSASSTRRKKAT